ncbi:hypothetical protein GPECTOR_39g376 [Gonium pectorale]|uniref:APAF-1 helical domain-containing protein n=1 Tax=Gonium pectorale TaxID=33097 RepID=A0A150GAL1_GONPE|nr:hypothetical protein GPECTOR_39g376 [Gonium pectorale]|eukprot:KXZ46882.1 hypothetical protein GPECTOR_39g376 [Gonium pectorale]
MGCTQSSTSRADSAEIGGQPAPTKLPGSFSDGKPPASPATKVRDSVQDIFPQPNNTSKQGEDEDGKERSKNSDGEAHGASHVKAATHTGGDSGPVPIDRTASTTSAGGAPCTPRSNSGGNDRKASTDATAAAKYHSNRSSFAAEGVNANGRPLPPARGSYSSDHGAPPSGLEAARSSQQARLSSIQAADVMGIGADKNVPTGRALTVAFDPLPDYSPPAPLAPAYPLLGALPPDTPVPLEVLRRLWSCGSGEAALALARAFAASGILRLASLEDGSCWALPAPQHVAHAAAAWPDRVASCHGRLLEAYGRRGETEVPLEGLRDDGYIIQALSHHLVGAGRLADLKSLLMNPGWLEAKLHAYGVGAVVRDFRRFLQEAETDEASLHVKLMLQAFQLSLGAAMEHPAVRMMREQMLARLMAVAAAGQLRDWYADQTAKCAAEGMLAIDSRLLHLMPRSPSLAQAGGVQRMTLRGHQAPIRRVAIAPNCCDVVTISDDGSAQVWDMNIGDCVMQLAREAPLTAVGVTPDSSSAVVAAADGTAAVWSLATGQVTRTLAGHTARINALAIDKQGIRVVTGSDDRTARVWNLHDGSCEAVLEGHGSATGMVGAVLDVCVCSDGTLAASASDDFTARVWDLDEDGECLHTLEGHQGWVTSVAFVGTSHRLITASHDSTARLWDALKGRCLAVLSGHSGRLNRVSVDPGGSWAVTCSDDNTARVWDAETGSLKLVLEGHSSHVADAAITRDGRKAITVSGDGTCGVWDMDIGRREVTLEGHTGEVCCVVLTQRGRFAVTAGEDCTARVWDLAAADNASPPPPTHGGRVAALGCLPGGDLVVSGGDDGRLIMWDPVEGACLKQMEGHRSGIRFMRVATEGDTVLTGSGDRQICRWNLNDFSVAANEVSRRRSMERRELMLATLTTAGGSAGGQSVATTTGGGARGFGVGGGGAGGAGGAASTPDLCSPTMLSTGGTGGHNRMTTTRFVVEGHTDGLVAADLSPDEQLLATAAYDRTVRVSRLATGAAVAVLDHPQPPVSVAFSPDSRRMAVALEDHSVVVWDLVGRCCLPSLDAHKATLSCLVWSPDSRFLATAGADCTLRLWRAADGRQTAFFMADAAITAACFAGHPVADIVVAGDAAGAVHFLDWSEELQA